MEYYSAIKGNEVLTRATTWMNLESMLSERSQTEKAAYRVVPFIRNVQNRQIHRDRKCISGCQGLREGGMGVTANRNGSSFWNDENVLKLVMMVA